MANLGAGILGRRGSFGEPLRRLTASMAKSRAIVRKLSKTTVVQSISMKNVASVDHPRSTVRIPIEL